MQLRHQVIALFINVIIVFQPVIPLLEYEVLHDYIVKELCINRNVPNSCCEGKCYLEKSLKDAGVGSTNDKENNKTPEKRFRQVESNLPEKPLTTRCFFSTFYTYTYVCSNYTFHNNQEIFHPPC